MDGPIEVMKPPYPPPIYGPIKCLNSKAIQYRWAHTPSHNGWRCVDTEANKLYLTKTFLLG